MASALGSILKADRPPVVRRRRQSRETLSFGLAGLFTGAWAAAGASVYLSLGLVASDGLGLTPVAIAAAGAVFAIAVYAYAEGASMFPESTGSAALSRHALNELVSFVAGWGMTLALVAVLALAALFVPHYLSVFWSPLGTHPWDVLAAVAVIGAGTLVASRGIAAPPGLRAFLVGGGLVTAVLLVVLGALTFPPGRVASNLDLGRAPSLPHLALAFALAALAYTGIESISTLAGDARTPADLSRTARLLVAVAVLLACAVSLVAVMAMPVHRVGGGYATALARHAPRGYAGDPLVGIAARLPLHVLSNGLQIYVGLVAATVLVIAGAAAAMTAARVVCSLARHYQLPARVAMTHPRYGTPVTANVLVACAAAALLFAGLLAADEPHLLGTLYVAGAMLAVTIVQISILVLRWREPHRHRAVMVRGNLTVRGRSMPVLVAIGVIATAAMSVVAFALSGPAGGIGAAWMGVGVAGYVAYRRRHRLSLTERRERVIVAETGPEIEVEFRSILIPINVDQATVPWDMIDIAARLAAEQRALIVLLTFTEIPLSEEMDIEIPDEQERVDRLADQARALGAQYGIRVHTTHLRTRDAAQSIVEEARHRQSEVILLGATGRERSTFHGYARDPITRRVAAESAVRVMFIQPEPSLSWHAS